MNACTLWFSNIILLTGSIFNWFRSGDGAKNAFHSNPKHTVFNAKRLIGCKMEEPEVKDEMREFVCIIS
jgi:Hsp70 protein